MTPFSCIILDDDPAVVEQLTEYITTSSELILVQSFTDPILALKHLEHMDEPVDILFTDVEMPTLTGLELAERTASKYRSLILVSGHLQYAIDGYTLNAQQFLSKPFDYRKFERTVSSVITKFPQVEASMTIRLSGKNRAVKLFHKDIIAIESASNYLKIHTIEKTYVPYGSLSDMQNSLKTFTNFRRISRSFIINTSFIKEILRYKIILDRHMTVTVGESYRKEFDVNFARYFKAGKG